jgi:hypothetical protein
MANGSMVSLCICFSNRHLKLFALITFPLQHNRSKLMMSFLGTGGHLPGQGGRATPCLAYVRQKDAWLIEAGEDSQRQLMYAEHIKPSKVSYLCCCGGLAKGEQMGYGRAVTRKPRLTLINPCMSWLGVSHEFYSR